MCVFIRLTGVARVHLGTWRAYRGAGACCAAAGFDWSTAPVRGDRFWSAPIGRCFTSCVTDVVPLLDTLTEAALRTGSLAACTPAIYPKPPLVGLGVKWSQVQILSARPSEVGS
jgi:hypothetical protein